MQQERKAYHAGLGNLSILDGRERKYTESLRSFLSEGALHYYRAVVMIQNLRMFSKEGIPQFPIITDKENRKITRILKTFNSKAVADYDHFGRCELKPVEHDVKAVELYLRERFDRSGLSHLKEFIHFPMTSEDVNNLAWNLMIRYSTNKVWLPATVAVCDQLSEKTILGAAIPVMGRTHGMSASTTTYGKRFGYLLDKFTATLDVLTKIRLTGKWGGPVGNHNAMTIALPEFDIESYGKKFVESFGFDYDPFEHQRNSHYSLVRFFNELNLVNMTALDLCKHIRSSVMLGLLDQTAPEGTVGSSVMPHKINPWFFEVAEGYLEQVISFIDAAKMGLIPSTFERDLTDHPWERSYGEIIGKSRIALGYIADGLQTLLINDTKALEELQATPEILTEAVQIVGRLYGVEDIYMKIKKLSRGKKLDRKTLDRIITKTIPGKKQRSLLKALEPERYYGTAAKQSYLIVKEYEIVKRKVHGGLLHPLAGISSFLFDFDQTLHFGDKEELHARLSVIVKKLRMGFTPEEVTSFGDRSDFQEMKKVMVESYNKKNNDRPLTEDAFQKANDAVTGSFDRLLYVAPHTKQLLTILEERGYGRALVTTRGRQSLDRILVGYGIEDCFSVIIGRGDAKERKPHPEPAARAQEKLGVTGPECIFIGDKLTDDVIAAKARDMQTIWVSKDARDTYGATPTYHFSSLEQIIELFSFV